MIDTELEARFWRYVTPADGDGCWLWQGAKLSNGYGQTERKWQGKRHLYLAHRLSYEVHYGPIPDGLFVCHRCDTPVCVHPDHLFLGTNKDNIHDAMRKGRVPQLTDAAQKPRGEKNGTHLHPERVRGERNGCSKLTADQVLEIRARYSAGGVSMLALGRAYGVTADAVRRVIYGRNWKHLPGAVTRIDPAMIRQNHLTGIKESYDYERLSAAGKKGCAIRYGRQS